MTALDWIFVVVLAASLLIGAWRGLVFELLSLAGWIVSFVVARWLAADAGAWLPMGDADAPWRHVAGFACVFVATMFACGLLAWLAQKLIAAVGLRPTDRALGALFGLLRGALLVLVLGFVALWTPLHEAPWWRQSASAPVLQALLAELRPVLPVMPAIPPLPAAAQELGRHQPS